MPILYHPTASYQFYVAPGSSSVSITAAIFNLGGVTLDSETESQSTGGPLVRGSGFADAFSPDLTALTRFGVNQKIYKGDFQQSATAEASNLRRTNLNSNFAATSHPTLHIDKPNVYTTTEDFDLNIYTFHGGGILGVDVSVDGGTAQPATLVSDPTTDGFGGKYTIPITSTTFGLGTTAEIRITSKPRNGYDRTMQMKLVYASGENKVQIDTNTGISAGVAAVMSNWDETKKNILELTESGNYTIGTNSNSSEIYEYGAVEVRPAAGVTAEIDLTYGSTNFPVEGQSNTISTGVRPKLNQMTWKNITFKQLLNEDDPYLWSESTKLGPNSDSPNALGYTGPPVQRTGIYLEDNAYTTRWTFIGCTMEQNWIDGTTQGIRYLFLDGSTSGSVGGGRLNGLKPTDHQMFRYSTDQQLYFIDTYAEEMQYPYSNALMCSNSISHRCYQDSYTNVKFSVGCKSTEKYMAGVAVGPDGVGATFIEATLSRHPDHWQLFRGGSRTGVEFHNNQGVTFNKLGVMNYALYGYEGDDIPRATQHFGFFGSPGREYYVDVAMVKSKWTGSTAGDQKSQIGENFDNILLIGLESTKPLLVDSDFNYPDPTIPPPASAEEQYGPVLLAGSTFGISIDLPKWNSLTILEGRTLGFLPVGNITPKPNYQGQAGNDDSLLGSYYVWNMPASSLTNINTSTARNIFAKNGNSPSTGWYIGSNSSAGASLSGAAPSTVIALGGTASFNTSSRVGYFGTIGDNDDIIDTITLTLYDGPDESIAFANSGGSAGWYGKFTTSTGVYVYGASPVTDTGQAGGNAKITGFNSGVLGGSSGGMTLGDLLGGFTFELKTTEM